MGEPPALSLAPRNVIKAFRLGCTQDLKVVKLRPQAARPFYTQRWMLFPPRNQPCNAEHCADSAAKVAKKRD